jgi:hypothetical protein
MILALLFIDHQFRSTSVAASHTVNAEMLEAVAANVDSEAVLDTARLARGVASAFATAVLLHKCRVRGRVSTQVVARRSNERDQGTSPCALHICVSHQASNEFGFCLWAGEGTIGENGGLVYPAGYLGDAVAVMRERGATTAGEESEEAGRVECEEETQSIVAWKIGRDADEVVVVLVLRPEAATSKDGESHGCKRDQR